MPAATIPTMHRNTHGFPQGKRGANGVGGTRFFSAGLKLLFWFVLPILMLALAAAYWVSGLNGDRFSRSTEPVEIVIANTVLSVPANMIRHRSQHVPHTATKLDLFVNWPDMQGYQEQTKTIFENPHDVSDLVFLTVEPRTMAYDMSGRLRPIYSRFFEGVAILTPSGLVQQPLTSSAGFAHEDLYFDPGNPYPFVARCTREGKNSIRATCMRDIHLAKDLMMTYRFDKKLLPVWAELDDKVRALGKRLK